MRPSVRVALHKLAIFLLVVVPLFGVVLAVSLLWRRYVFWSDLAIFALMYTLTGLGVTVGYHRMLTHEGFKAPWWLRAFFIICGAMSCDGQPLPWTATHIKHHAHSDEERDPHSPLQGFWHAHMGWLFHPRNFADPAQYCPALLQDRVVVFVDRFYVLWIVLALAIPFALGGWTGLLWGGLVRIFLTTHVTWSVNSVCHTFGKRAFETTDESRNEWIVGLLAFGEGWHNNHHAFPRNAFHGMRWWQVDLSGVLISLLESAGLVWDVQRVSRETEEAQRLRSRALQLTVQTLRQELAAKISSAQSQLARLLEEYAKPRATDQEMLSMVEQWERRLARLREIQNRLVLATHLKKQQLLLYLREVSELVPASQS